MKRKSYINKLLLILTACFLLNISLLAQEKKKPIDVGIILDLSGSLVPVANKMRKGIDLALSEDDTYPINIVYEDDKSMDNVQALKAFQRLANFKKTQVVLNWASITFPAIAPIANKSKIPVVSFWDSNLGLLKMGPYIFAIGISTEKAAQKIAEYMYSEKEKKRVALISLNDPWSEIISKSFKERYINLGGEIIAEDVVNPNEKDLRTIIIKAKNKSVDAIFSASYLESLYSTVKQAKELGYEGSIFTADGFYEEDIKHLGSYVEGVYSSQTIVKDESFLNKYKEKYGKVDTEISIGIAGLGYDAVKMLSEIFKKLETSKTPITNETIREELTRTRYQGVTGLSAPAEESTKVESIVVVKDGKFVEAE